MIADARVDEHGEEHAERGDATEDDLPARGVEERRQRSEREKLPGLSDEPRELTHQRAALRGEPRRNQSQHAGEYGSIDFLSFGMYSFGYVINQFGDEIATELFPFFHLGRIFNRFNINPRFCLEISNTLITIAIIKLGIFPVHYKTVFLP